MGSPALIKGRGFGIRSIKSLPLIIERARDMGREIEGEREGEKGRAYWFVLSPNTLDYIVLCTQLVFHSFCDVT